MSEPESAFIPERYAEAVRRQRAALSPLRPEPAGPMPPPGDGPGEYDPTADEVAARAAALRSGLPLDGGGPRRRTPPAGPKVPKPGMGLEPGSACPACGATVKKNGRCYTCRPGNTRCTVRESAANQRLRVPAGTACPECGHPVNSFTGKCYNCGSVLPPAADLKPVRRADEPRPDPRPEPRPGLPPAALLVRQFADLLAGLGDADARRLVESVYEQSRAGRPGAGGGGGP